MERRLTAGAWRVDRGGASGGGGVSGGGGGGGKGNGRGADTTAGGSAAADPTDRTAGAARTSATAVAANGEHTGVCIASRVVAAGHGSGGVCGTEPPTAPRYRRGVGGVQWGGMTGWRSAWVGRLRDRRGGGRGSSGGGGLPTPAHPHRPGGGRRWHDRRVARTPREGAGAGGAGRGRAGRYPRTPTLSASRPRGMHPRPGVRARTDHRRSHGAVPSQRRRKGWGGARGGKDGGGEEKG